eukprot:gene17532-biopygen12885
MVPRASCTLCHDGGGVSITNRTYRRTWCILRAPPSDMKPSCAFDVSGETAVATRVLRHPELRIICADWHSWHRTTLVTTMVHETPPRWGHLRAFFAAPPFASEADFFAASPFASEACFFFAAPP